MIAFKNMQEKYPIMKQSLYNALVNLLKSYQDKCLSGILNRIII